MVQIIGEAIATRGEVAALPEEEGLGPERLAQPGLGPERPAQPESEMVSPPTGSCELLSASPPPTERCELASSSAGLPTYLPRGRDDAR
eukprot:6973691-Heterocapsa_arctica.AAC.1